MSTIVGFFAGKPVYLPGTQAKAAPPSRDIHGARPEPSAEPAPALTVVSRIARLNAIDKDRDVLLPGLVGPGADVLISAWGHASWQPGFLPVGRGRLAEQGDSLIFKGAFFDTAAGREHHSVLKAMGASEWSFGFTILKSHRGTHQGEHVRFLDAVDIREVSPVLVGASVGSAILELAQASGASLMVAAAARENDAALRALRHPNAARTQALLREARRLGVPVGATMHHK